MMEISVSFEFNCQTKSDGQRQIFNCKAVRKVWMDLFGFKTSMFNYFFDMTKKFETKWLNQYSAARVRPWRSLTRNKKLKRHDATVRLRTLNLRRRTKILQGKQYKHPLSNHPWKTIDVIVWKCRVYLKIAISAGQLSSSIKNIDILDSSWCFKKIASFFHCLY